MLQAQSLSPLSPTCLHTLSLFCLFSCFLRILTEKAPSPGVLFWPSYLKVQLQPNAYVTYFPAFLVSNGLHVSFSHRVLDISLQNGGVLRAGPSLCIVCYSIFSGRSAPTLSTQWVCTVWINYQPLCGNTFPSPSVLLKSTASGHLGISVG